MALDLLLPKHIYTERTVFLGGLILNQNVTDKINRGRKKFEKVDWALKLERKSLV